MEIQERQNQSSSDKYYTDMLGDLSTDAAKRQERKQQLQNEYLRGLTGINNSVDNGRKIDDQGEHLSNVDRQNDAKLEAAAAALGVKKKYLEDMIAAQKAKFAEQQWAPTASRHQQGSRLSMRRIRVNISKAA